MRLVSTVSWQVRFDVNRRYCLAENTIRRGACVSLVALLAADAAVFRLHVDVILSPERYVIFRRTVVPAPQIRTNPLRMSAYTAKFANYIKIPGAGITTAHEIARPFTAIQTNCPGTSRFLVALLTAHVANAWFRRVSTLEPHVTLFATFLAYGLLTGWIRIQILLHNFPVFSSPWHFLHH